ncbi:ATP-dependent DNA helicase Q-like 2-like protein [Drosera capensis]
MGGVTDEILEQLLSVKAELVDVQDQIKILLDQQEKLYQRQSELKALLEVEEYEASGSHQPEGCSAGVENWSGSFEWDSRADDVRFNLFGISAYRANQREIINAIMSNKDVLVIMAAGGGKSLCYQLPAILRDGVALVVSPLLSLIQDQVMGLTALGIPAYMLTSTTGKEDEKFIYKALEKGEGELKILYVTPEKISKSKRFMSKLEKCHHAGRISLIAIDEAHCCSQWGHDFRLDYKNLSILKTQFPTVPVIALTATATRKVQIDLIEMLCIPKCVKFVSSVNRPNLFYMVREKSSVGKIALDEIAEFITQSYPNNESGIVYCFSRKECEQVAKDLRERGVKADHYHADMDAKDRERVHTRWSNGKLQVIVGTESGRAGRDGLPAECLLYYRPADVPRQSSMVFYENSGLQNLYDIVRYSQSRRECRRASFFKHFAEPLQDCNGHAKAMISLLQDTQASDQRSTMLQLVDKMKAKNKDTGQNLKKEEVEKLVIQLVVDRVLKEEYQHTAYSTNAYVTLGPLAKQVLQGNRVVKLEISSESESKVGNIKSAKRRATSSELEMRLDELRKELASTHGGIFPHSLETIIGKVKSDKYGRRILEEISSKATQEHLDGDYGGEATENRAPKKMKAKKALVVIESSEDDG